MKNPWNGYSPIDPFFDMLDDFGEFIIGFKNLGMGMARLFFLLISPITFPIINHPKVKHSIISWLDRREEKKDKRKSEEGQG